MPLRPSHRLRVSTLFRAPVEEVWAHKTDPQALMAELPPWLPFKITRPAALREALEAGAESIRSPARLGWIPWEAQFQLLEPGRCYVNRGESRLMDLFIHARSVDPSLEGTHYCDDIWFVPRTSPWLTARILRRAFVARHERTARVLAADPRTVGRAVLRQVLEDETLPAYVEAHLRRG